MTPINRVLDTLYHEFKYFNNSKKMYRNVKMADAVDRAMREYCRGRAKQAIQDYKLIKRELL